MSGVLGTLGLAVLDNVVDNVNNWLQGNRNVINSKKLIDYQNEAYLRQQTELNRRLYPQMVASMRSAGLNPAMISGPMNQGASMSSSSQNMAAPRMDTLGAAQAVSALQLNESQKDLNEASAENLRSEAEVNRKDAELKDNDLFTYFENKTIEWEKMISEKYANNANSLVAEEKVNEIRKQIDIMSENINILRENLKGVQESNKWIAPQAKANISKLRSEASYISGQESRESNSFYLRLDAMKAENFKTTMEGNYIRLQNDALDFSFNLDKKFGTGERWLNLWNRANDAFWGSVLPVNNLFGRSQQLFQKRRIYGDKGSYTEYYDYR